MTTITIRPDMTMEEILRIAPAAQRALFQRYHVGGCSSCGFQPTDTLAQLCKERNILDVAEAIRTIVLAQEMDSNLQVEPSQVRAWLAEHDAVTFLDVRMPDEAKLKPVPEAEPLDYEDSGRYMSLPKDRRIVFACQDGGRALDVAAYFKGHGFTAVHSLRGGFDAWSNEGRTSFQRA
jgi:rhodanese-related sulfurtransferase